MAVPITASLKIGARSPPFPADPFGPPGLVPLRAGHPFFSGVPQALELSALDLKLRKPEQCRFIECPRPRAACAKIRIWGSE